MPDPKKFNLDDVRLSQDFANQVGIKKARLTVRVRKPGRHDFLRVHDDPGWMLEPWFSSSRTTTRFFLSRRPSSTSCWESSCRWRCSPP